jgi:CBS domain-containing protein
MNRKRPVKWVMKRPAISVDEKCKLHLVIPVFRQYKFNHIPITSFNRLTGIISKEDVWKLLFDQYSDKTRNENFDLSKILVSEIMSKSPVRVYENQAIELAVEILLQGNFHALPVINQEEEVVGMITAADLLKAYYQESS